MDTIRKERCDLCLVRLIQFKFWYKKDWIVQIDIAAFTGNQTCPLKESTSFTKVE